MLRLVLFRVLESYFRHRFLFLLPVALMIVFAGVKFVSAKSTYISRGALYVQKQSLLGSLTNVTQDGFSWSSASELTVGEVKELLQTDSFVRAVIQMTDLEKDLNDKPGDAETLYDRVRTVVWVQTLGDSLIMIGAADEDPKIAHQLAQGTIENYLQWKINSDRQGSSSAQAFFAQLIVDYSTQLDAATNELKKYLESHPDPVRGDRPSLEKLEIERLQAVINQTKTTLDEVTKKEQDSRLNMAKAESDTRQKYFVLDSPNLPGQAENSKTAALISSMIFVVVGFVLVVVLTIGAALLDRTVRFPVDVRHQLHLPVLAAVPDLTPKGKKEKKPKEAKK